MRAINRALCTSRMSIMLMAAHMDSFLSYLHAWDSPIYSLYALLKDKVQNQDAPMYELMPDDGAADLLHLKCLQP